MISAGFYKSCLTALDIDLAQASHAAVEDHLRSMQSLHTVALLGKLGLLWSGADLRHAFSSNQSSFRIELSTRPNLDFELR